MSVASPFSSFLSSVESAEPPPFNSHADTDQTDTGNEEDEPKGMKLHTAGVMGIMRTSWKPILHESLSGVESLAVPCSSLSHPTQQKQRQTNRTKTQRSDVQETKLTLITDDPLNLAPTCTDGDSLLPYAYDLPAERDSGNIEYKWKLIEKSADRLIHLTTQLAYRLSEGDGEMLYELGVADSGVALGLTPQELHASIRTVEGMAHTLQCKAQIIVHARGREGEVAEVLVRRIGEVTSGVTPTGLDSTGSSATFPGHSGDLRIALLGDVSSGVSSLLGCLVSNQRDDGRGRSRLHVFRHRHEIENGRTSAIARQIIGFDKNGYITNYQVHHKQTLGLNQDIAAHTAAPAAPAEKREKGITSLFGGGSDDDESTSSDDDDYGSDDFGFDSPICDVYVPPHPVPPPAAVDDSYDFGLSSGDAHACSSHDWQRILDESHKVYTLFDLPSEYFKTTIYGLIGTSCPDYACIVVSCHTDAEREQAETTNTTIAHAGSATHHRTNLLSSLTREQIMLCCALGIPFLLILCKSDLATADHRTRLLHALEDACLHSQTRVASSVSAATHPGVKLLRHRIPLLVSHDSLSDTEWIERNMTSTIAIDDIPEQQRQRIIGRTQRRAAHCNESATNLALPPHTLTPVFMLSNVTGEGFDLFKRHLGRLANYRQPFWQAQAAPAVPTYFSIDDIFTVDSVGSVVSGTILSGGIREGDTLLLGPIPSPVDLHPTDAAFRRACQAQFRPVLVKSLHISRKCFRNARAGQSVTLALKKVERNILRRGMVLLTQPHALTTSDDKPSVLMNVTIDPPLPIVRPACPRSCVGFEAYIHVFDPSASRCPPSIHRHGDALMRNGGVRYQPIVHVGNVRQSAEIIGIRLVKHAQSVQTTVDEWIKREMAAEHTLSNGADKSAQPDLDTLLDAHGALDDTAPTVSTGVLSPFDRSIQSAPLAAGSSALVRFEFLYQSEYLRVGQQVLFREDRTRGTGIITRLYFVDEPQTDRLTPSNTRTPPPLVALTPSPPLHSDVIAPSASPPPVSSASSSPQCHRSSSSSPCCPRSSPTRLSQSQSQSQCVLQLVSSASPSPTNTSHVGFERRKRSDSKITRPTNVFQIAKERRRIQEATSTHNHIADSSHYPVATSMSPESTISESAPHSSLPACDCGGTDRHATDTCFDDSDDAARVDSHTRLAHQPRPTHASLHQHAERPHATLPVLLHASPPASYGVSDFSSMRSVSPLCIPPPPHSISDSDLSTRAAQPSTRRSA